MVYFKKTFLLSFVFFFFVSFYEAEGVGNPVAGQTPQNCMTVLNSYLVPGEGDNPPALSIKSDCKEYKADATECCNNPNNCAGLMMDVAKTAGPALPGLYSAYKAYENSEKASEAELSHEEIQSKICDTNNKAALGGFAAQLFSQMSTMFETTCKDKIEDCKDDCNGQIGNFRETFKRCFSHVPSGGTVEGLIDIAKQCGKIEDVKDFPINNSKEIKKTDSRTVACLLDTSGKVVESDQINCKEFKCIKKQDIQYILMFAKAYKNSSAIESLTLNKMEGLSENSDEKKIVNCSRQPDRVVTPRNNPGAPVPPPHLRMCYAVTDSFQNGSPPPPMPGNSPGDVVDSTGSLAGQLTTPEGHPDWMYETKGYGIVDDYVPPPKSWPNRVASSPGGSSNSPAASVAGASPGAGGLGPSSKEKAGSGYPPLRSGSAYDSFSGGSGGFQNPANSGTSGSPYRQAASKDEKGLGKVKPFPGKDENKDMNPNEADSIFQIASRRIQTFCSDHSCIAD